MHNALIAVACGALLSIGTASAMTGEPTDTTSLPVQQIAKHGADDPVQAPDCDDHGTDVCVSIDRIARKGADDPAPPPAPCDDQGTDICMSVDQVARKGADDPVQAPDCDDHGTDVCFVRT